ncbi:MAG: hypothetical protein OER21_07650 [Gemmatimonadota bacterium]|nr:hypothetical protein [Gemmatimonadota bacterium]
MPEETYDPERAERLVELLRTLAVRIMELDDGALLAAGPDLMKVLGDIRSELFHYEVRCTYDTPDAAESRRIADEARQQQDEWTLEDEDDRPWRDSS